MVVSIHLDNLEGMDLLVSEGEIFGFIVATMDKAFRDFQIFFFPAVLFRIVNRLETRLLKFMEGM